MWRQTHELFSCTETTLNNQYLKCILPSRLTQIHETRLEWARGVNQTSSPGSKVGKKLFLSTLELELYTCNAAYYHNYAIHRHSGHVLGLFVNVFDMMIMDLMLSFTIWTYLKIRSLNLSKFYWKNKTMADNSMPYSILTSSLISWPR